MGAHVTKCCEATGWPRQRMRLVVFLLLCALVGEHAVVHGSSSAGDEDEGAPTSRFSRLKAKAEDHWAFKPSEWVRRSRAFWTEKGRNLKAGAAKQSKRVGEYVAETPARAYEGAKKRWRRLKSSTKSALKTKYEQAKAMKKEVPPPNAITELVPKRIPRFQFPIIHTKEYKIAAEDLVSRLVAPPWIFMFILSPLMRATGITGLNAWLIKAMAFMYCNSVDPVLACDPDTKYFASHRMYCHIGLFPVRLRFNLNAQFGSGDFLRIVA